MVLTGVQMLWAFSIWLESVAILPQLFMLQRTGEAETITTHYLFALGLYRALYIPNWIWRYFAESWFDIIAVVAGLVQTVLYSDFFWIYYTKYAITKTLCIHDIMLTVATEFFKARSSTCRCRIRAGLWLRNLFASGCTAHVGTPQTSLELHSLGVE